ncbi:MAG: hypothetical protein JWQ09_5038 [Segetibacter sp.]|nr:hypothetical protein [Segetibacter sp.]
MKFKPGEVVRIINTPFGVVKDVLHKVGSIGSVDQDKEVARPYWVQLRNIGVVRCAESDLELYQEEITELPEYFIIQSDLQNPLWNKYIDWLNDKFKAKDNWSGKNWRYYGYDGSVLFNGINAWDTIERFLNNPVLITLEQWNKIVNKLSKEEEFVLPEKWCVKLTQDSKDFLEKLLYDHKDEYVGYKDSWNTDPGVLTNYFHYPQKTPHSHSETRVENGYTKITIEQLLKSKQTNMEKEMIGYKAPSNLFQSDIIKGDIYVKPSNGYGIISKHCRLATPEEIKASQKPSLPKINGKDGVIEGEIINYNNCAKFHKSFFAKILDATNNFEGNRTISKITLNSGVEIAIEEIKQIIEAIKAS